MGPADTSSAVDDLCRHFPSLRISLELLFSDQGDFFFSPAARAACGVPKLGSHSRAVLFCWYVREGLSHGCRNNSLDRLVGEHEDSL